MIHSAKRLIDIVEELCNKFGNRHLLLWGNPNMDPVKHTGTIVKYVQPRFQAYDLKELKPIPEPAFTGISKIDYILSTKPDSPNSTYGLLPNSSLNTFPHRAIMLTLSGIRIVNPEVKNRLYKVQMWDKVYEEVYRKTAEELMANYPEVSDAGEAIQYLIKVLNTVTHMAVCTKIVKPHIKPKPFNEEIAAS